MEDSEINKRVAEIEGLNPLDRPGRCIIPDWFLRADKTVGDGDLILGCLYEPATDWAWCGPLVEKYQVTLDSCPSCGWLASTPETDDMAADTPQRAICLAVLAAHEGK